VGRAPRGDTNLADAELRDAPVAVRFRRSKIFPEKYRRSAMGISRNLQCKTLKTPVKMRERKNNGKQWHQQWKTMKSATLIQPQVCMWDQGSRSVAATKTRRDQRRATGAHKTD